MSDKLLGPSTGYVDLFMEQMEDNNRTERANGKAFQRTPIRPSSSGKCARELYLELQEYTGQAKYNTEPMSGETLLLLDLGHAIESHLIRKIRQNFSAAEVRYTQQVLNFIKIEAINDTRLNQHLEGSIDLVLWSEKHKCCVDVKSKGDNYNFRSRKMKWDEDSDKLGKMASVQKISDRAFWVDDLDAFLVELQDPFFEANFKQLNLYLNSDFIKERGIDHGAIIQYHKNKSKLREIRFRPSTTVYEATINKFKNVVRAIDEDKIELAPAEYDPASFKSRYCNFCKAKVPGSCAMANKSTEVKSKK